MAVHGAKPHCQKTTPEPDMKHVYDICMTHSDQ